MLVYIEQFFNVLDTAVMSMHEKKGFWEIMYIKTKNEVEN